MDLNLAEYSKSKWEWYFIASGQWDETVNFIVKDEGKFANYLFSHFLDDLDKLPEIRMKRPVETRCHSAIHKRTCVFIGEDEGFTPFLAFLRTMPLSIPFVTYVFITNNPELMNWVSWTIKDLKLTKKDMEQVQIFLFLTQKRKAYSLEQFLFQRAFLLARKNQIEEKEGQFNDILFNIPIKVEHRKPDLKQILLHTAERSRQLENMEKEVSVFSCGVDTFNKEVKSVCKEASKMEKEEFVAYLERLK